MHLVATSKINVTIHLYSVSLICDMRNISNIKSCCCVNTTVPFLSIIDILAYATKSFQHKFEVIFIIMFVRLRSVSVSGVSLNNLQTITYYFRNDSYSATIKAKVKCHYFSTRLLDEIIYCTIQKLSMNISRLLTGKCN